MFFGLVFTVWLVLTWIPLQINPELLVQEVTACCHHQIHLKCKSNEKIGIIQARYVPADPKNNRAPDPEPAGLPVVSRMVNLNKSSVTRATAGSHPYISLWDMDPKFTHDLHRKPQGNILSSLNAPEWAKVTYDQDFPISSHRVRRYTTPNPLPTGINVSVLRTIQMPTSNDQNYVDKDTLWMTPLFHVITEESQTSSNTGTSGRIRNTRFGGAGSGSDLFPQCLSYEALMLEAGSGVRESRRVKEQLSKPHWDHKDLRPVFNQRCSGRSECVVNLLKNKLRDQELTRVCHKWPDGRIVVKYLCLNPTAGEVHTKCNEEINPAREGFLWNPGYPNIYHGDKVCQWRLKSVSQQQILLIFLDISIRGEEKSQCVDKVVVSEGRSKLLSTCGDHSSAIAILSYGSHVNVTLSAQSRLAFPKRGFLLYFRAIGCVKPAEPLNSYLVFRNGTHALFACERNYIFLDTHSSYRWLACNSLDHTWGTFPACAEHPHLRLRTRQPIIVRKNTEMTSTEEKAETDSEPTLWPSTNRNVVQDGMMRDFVVPCVIIVLLLSVNALVLLWIWRRRKRQELEFEAEEAKETREMDILNQDVTPDADEASTFTLASAGIDSFDERAQPWNLKPLSGRNGPGGSGSSPFPGTSTGTRSTGGDFNADEDEDVQSRQYNFSNSTEKEHVAIRNGYYAPLPSNDPGNTMTPSTTTTATTTDSSYKNHFPKPFRRSTPV